MSGLIAIAIAIARGGWCWCYALKLLLDAVLHIASNWLPVVVVIFRLVDVCRITIG
jgi:hypothetical protein